TDEQIGKLRAWIDAGAVWEESAKSTSIDPKAQLAALEDMPIPPEARNYWAFRKPVRPAVPGSGNPIDAFLAKTWRDKGLKAAPEADRNTLLRRAYLDLTGLPPTPAEASEFLNDKKPGAW